MIPSNSEPSVTFQGSRESVGRSQELSPQLQWCDNSAAECRPTVLAKSLVYEMPDTSTSYLADKAHVEDCTNNKKQSHEAALITYMCLLLVKKVKGRERSSETRLCFILLSNNSIDIF